MPKQASGWDQVRVSLADAEKTIRDLHREMDRDIRHEHASGRVDVVDRDRSALREPARQGM